MGYQQKPLISGMQKESLGVRMPLSHMYKVQLLLQILQNKLGYFYKQMLFIILMAKLKSETYQFVK